MKKAPRSTVSAEAERGDVAQAGHDEVQAAGIAGAELVAQRFVPRMAGQGILGVVHRDDLAGAQLHGLAAQLVGQGVDVGPAAVVLPVFEDG